jgi:hypothetical protein
MYTAQQIQGPVAPGQYTGQQVAGVSAYYPLQTDQWTGMFGMMMPMIMLILMFAIISPMLKGVTGTARE